MKPAFWCLYVPDRRQGLDRAAVPIHALVQAERVRGREDLFAFGAAADFGDDAHCSRTSSIASAIR